MKSQVEFTGRIKKTLLREISDAVRAAEGYDLADIVSRIASLGAEQRDPAELIKFVSQIEVVGPRGKLRFDKNHEPILEAMIQQWIPEGQSFKQEIIEDVGSVSSIDFGCGRVGFPKRPDSGQTEELQLDTGDDELFGQ